MKVAQTAQTSVHLASSTNVVALVAELEKAAADGCPTAPQVLAKKDYLAKKSVWIFGEIGRAHV